MLEEELPFAVMTVFMYVSTRVPRKAVLSAKAEAGRFKIFAVVGGKWGGGTGCRKVTPEPPGGTKQERRRYGGRWAPSKVNQMIFKPANKLRDKSLLKRYGSANCATYFCAGYITQRPLQSRWFNCSSGDECMNPQVVADRDLARGEWRSPFHFHATAIH